MAEKVTASAPATGGVTPNGSEDAPQNASGTVFERAAREEERFYHERRVELRAARMAGSRWRALTRWLGLAVFLIGAGLLGWVFWQALGALQEFGSAGRLNTEFDAAFNAANAANPAVAGAEGAAPGAAPGGNAIVSVIRAVGAVLGTELLRVLYLLILGFVASALAARGIQFFAASESVIDEAVVPEE